MSTVQQVTVRTAMFDH